jgi:hypothetical protein
VLIEVEFGVIEKVAGLLLQKVHGVAPEFELLNLATHHEEAHLYLKSGDKCVAKLGA